MGGIEIEAQNIAKFNSSVEGSLEEKFLIVSVEVK